MRLLSAAARDALDGMGDPPGPAFWAQFNIGELRRELSDFKRMLREGDDVRYAQKNIANIEKAIEKRQRGDSLSSIVRDALMRDGPNGSPDQFEALVEYELPGGGLGRTQQYVTVTAFSKKEAETRLLAKYKNAKIVRWVDSLSSVARDALTSFQGDPSLERRFSGGDADPDPAEIRKWNDSLADLLDRVRGGIREQTGDASPDEIDAYYKRLRSMSKEDVAKEVGSRLSFSHMNSESKSDLINAALNAKFSRKDLEAWGK